MRLAAIALTLLLTASSGAALAQEERQVAAALAAQRCAKCHGIDGKGVDTTYASLAGQHPEYLIKQLFNFKTGVRTSDYMQPVVERRTAQEIALLAAHFSRLPAAVSAVRDAAQVAAGRRLYLEGNTRTGVGACVTCHGPQALGGTLMPRLAGQNAPYLEAQVKSFVGRARSNDQMMHLTVSALSEPEIQALAAYLSTEK